MQPLKISDNRRFIVTESGRPFFYLADTAWELFHRLDRPQASRYLQDRAAKGFTVIQAVALGEMDGLRVPNPYGHVPLEDNDPTKPVEAYWRHVDWIVDHANSLGLTIGFLPTWGDKWNRAGWGFGPEIFTPDNAFVYGRWLGQRYRDKGIIWIVGGDRKVETPLHRQIIEQTARGLREGDGGRHLISFHPRGGDASSNYFHEADWLDFNMWQTGHGRNRANYDAIARDYARTNPIKPVIDAEPGYEDHPSEFNLDHGYLDDYDCRKFIYWSTFAGACGHTYGCHPIWQFWQSDLAPKSYCRREWEDAMHLPGSGQMQWCRRLLESRPYLTRVPDQSLIVSENKDGSRHRQATRDIDGSYALVYCPYYADDVEIELSKLSGDTLVVHWYDPRTGNARFAGTVGRTAGVQKFTPPTGGPDWVLVLDDIARNFGPPGVGRVER